MAEKKFYIGTHGPYYYDDADSINDPDGDFSGLSRRGFATQGTIIAEESPTADNEVIRMIDLEDGDTLNGDHVDVDYSPSNYTPDASISEADDAEDLAAHLKGIDDEFGSLGDAAYEDYEEGTYTVTCTPATSGSVTLDSSYNTLAYTKKGQEVSIQGQIRVDSVSSPSGRLEFSLPFTPAAGGADASSSAGTLLANNLALDTDYTYTGLEVGGTIFKIREMSSTGWQEYGAGSNTFTGNEVLIVHLSYITAS